MFYRLHKRKLPLMFRYSTWVDITFLIISLVASLCSGIIQPFMSYFFGDVTEHIVDFASTVAKVNLTEAEIHLANETLMANLEFFVIALSALGLATVCLTYVSVYLINYSCTRQVSKIRSRYMKSLLNQDISWYDLNPTGDFSSRIIEDLGKIEEALGDKLSTCVFYIANFISGVIFGVAKGWKLGLMCLVYLPASLITMAVVSWLCNKLVKKELDAYGAAGVIAEEVFTAVRTVVAFGGQQKEVDRYNECLHEAKNQSIRRSLFTAISKGIMWLLAFGSFALSFYYGIKLILDDREIPEEDRIYTPGNMLTVFFCIFSAIWNFDQCTLYFEIWSSANVAASSISKVICNVSTINACKGQGEKLIKIEKNISFSNVHFHYPSRPDVEILQGLNLTINAGETVALVGSSGCGKSTCIQLLQRLYDPLKGSVEIDGVNLKDLDLRSLRNHIGVVGQEPVLFATSIEENIRYGNRSATLEQIEAAAKKANAHDFIKRLPRGYDTMIGERGAQLSGGQKQRIAIARALVKEPAILLLDEATSALDTQSEAKVQDALDKACQGCTTVIVAHRLTTIRGADRIIVITEGKVIEDGNHDTLMALKGTYFNLVTSQVGTDVDKDATDYDDSNEFLSDLETTKKLSITSDDIEIEDLTKHKSINVLKLVWKVLRFNSPEWWQMCLACTAATVAGSAFPLYSIVFGDIVGVLSNSDSEFVRQEGNRFSMYFAFIGIGTGIAAFFQWYMFNISAEKLTMRVRGTMFETMLGQEMGWYDRHENGVGALCAKLSNDASGIQGASGSALGLILNSLSNVAIAFGISFYYEWRITMVAFCFVPIIFVTMYMEQKFLGANTCGNKSAIESSAKIAVEAISNVRTITSLGCETVFHKRYQQELHPHYQRTKHTAHLRGIVLGLARSLMTFTYAVAIYYGGTLIRDEHLNYAIVFKITESLLTSTWSVSCTLAFAPNFQKGFLSAARFFNLLKRRPAIINDDNGRSIAWDRSNINYNNIKFSYPTRPNIPILRNLNLEVLHGKTVALVGQSGCGKSTIVQLLERFYDPLSGEVTIDQDNIMSAKLSSLRSQLGIVSQEPNLFDRTIAENIAYGDNTREVPQQEILEAAKNANIHNFISSLPLGYDTRLGEKGTQLSGGQKQRVAIARALVRNPQVLLLDEATSALDTESEKVVQDALDNAKQGRTCITIAHRLRTIQDADVICVIEKGVIAEMGTHSELLEQKGLYYKLYSMQIRH